MEKLTLMQKLVESGVIAICRKVPKEKLEQVASSIIEGGVTALEITVDSPGAFDAIKHLSSKYKGQAIIGAGTVIDSETARLAIYYGADFILSPSLHEGVIRTANRYGKIAVPGVMSPTEMVTALELGADFVKLFPAGGLGVSYLKDIKAPFPQISVIPTGGINLENVATFIEAKVAAVGIGSSLLDRKAIEASDFQKLTEIARSYVETIRLARSTFPNE